MYEQVFQFAKRPFTQTPFADDYCAIGSIEEVRSIITRAVESSSGPVLVVGPNGLGKSMLLAKLRQQFESQFSTTNLNCSKWTKRIELLQSLMFELNQPYKNLDEGELRLALMDFVRPKSEQHGGLLLLLDDAHNLHPRILDELSLMTNIVRDGKPRIQLVMSGLYRLEETLTHPKLTSLNQRIVSRCYLRPLDCAQTRQYVTERIGSAGRKCTDIFSEDSIAAVFEFTNGVPRLINQLCDAALLRAAADGIITIGKSHIEAVWSEIYQIPLLQTPTSPRSAASIEFGPLEPQQDGLETYTDSMTSRQLDDVTLDLDHQSISQSNEAEPTLQAAILEEHGDSSFACEMPAENVAKPMAGFSGPTEIQLMQSPLQNSADPFGHGFDSEEIIENTNTELTSNLNKSAAAITPQQMHALVDSTIDLEQLQFEVNEIQATEIDSFNHGEQTSQHSTDSDRMSVLRHEATPSRETELHRKAVQRSPEVGTGTSTPQAKSIPAQTSGSANAFATGVGWSETELLQQIYEQQSAIAQQLDATLNVSVNTGESSIHAPEVSKSIHIEFDRPLPGKVSGRDQTKNRMNLSDDDVSLRRIETKLTGNHDDDRDMIIISQEQQDDHRSTATDDNVEAAVSDTPSTGKAKRVDYETLFAHLRASN
jgi:type II secretory pathway predicted ATPase ExeA